MLRRTALKGLMAGALAAPAMIRKAGADTRPAAIGVINDMNGAYSDLGGTGSVLAAQMAAEDFGGSVLGNPIRILAADHQNKADLATSLTSEWIERSGVTAIADGGASSTALAIYLATGPATSDLTGARCSPYGFHWTYDSYCLAAGSALALLARGGRTWFFITADYAFGHSVERDATEIVTKGGGKSLGHVLAPIGTSDFSSHLLQAQASGADVIALALGGGDLVNAVKQAREFGLRHGPQAFVGLLTFNTDVHAMGLEAAEGMFVTTAYDWEINPEMNAFARRFMARHGGKPPSMVQAGTYGGVLHYLKAVREAGTLDTDAVADKMRALPVNDFMSENVHIRKDGRVMRPVYVAKVKTPSESKKPWDYLAVLDTIPPEKAFRPLAEGRCPLVAK